MITIKSAKYLKDPSDTNIAVETVMDEGKETNVTKIVSMDNNNRHYQAILEWVKAGNSITAAD